MTEGHDINHEINRITSIKTPQEADSKTLKRMEVIIS